MYLLIKKNYMTFSFFSKRDFISKDNLFQKLIRNKFEILE